MKKYLIPIFFITLLLISCFVAVAAGEEEKFDDGWVIVDRHLCYYENNERTIGMKYIDGLLFFFTNDGYLEADGEVKGIYYNNDPNKQYIYLDENNCLVSGWQLIHGDTYYFMPDELYACTNVSTIENQIYVFNSTGVLQRNNWHKSSYADEDGLAVLGYQKIDNQYYYFNSDGESQDGFVSINGKLHFFLGSENGYYFKHPEAKEWTYIDNKWFYFDPNTGEITTGNKTIQNYDFSFSNYGYLIIQNQLTILPFINGLCCINQDGIMQKGWIEINGNQYYAYYTEHMPDGEFEFNYFVSGLQEIYENKIMHTYFFDENYVMQKNKIIKIEDDFYYFGSDGRMSEGLINVDENTYYFQPEMVFGWTEILVDNRWKSYYFDENGIMLKDQFFLEDDSIYYFDINGQLYSGWLEKDGWLYYFNTSAYVSTRKWLTYNGNYTLYIFDEYGRTIPEGHIHEPGNPEIMEPTYTKPGYYNVYCELCNLLLNNSKTVPPMCEMNILYIPADVQTIEMESFMNNACTAVYINDNCNTIASKAFYGCENLKYVFIPEHTSYETDSFAECADDIIFFYR